MVTGAVRVFIATTEGPSEIQRIVAEDVDVRSVVCLDGTSEALPISRDYDAFVRKPTGVVERLFGHPSFRVDVSHRISHGRSWQLGFLAAHALHAAGRLAGPGMNADAVLWVTGEVRHELAVAGVEQCRDKVRRSEALLTELARDGIPTTLLIPEENQAEVEDEADHLGLSRGAITIRGVRDWAAVGLDGDDPRPSPHPRRRIRPILAAAIGVMVATGAYAAWTIHSAWDRIPSPLPLIAKEKEVQPQPEPAATAAPPPSPPPIVESEAAQLPPPKPVEPKNRISVDAIELRAPDGAGCGSLRLTGMAPEETEVAADPSGIFPPGSAQGLCGLEFRIGKSEGEPEAAWIYLLSTMEGDSAIMKRRVIRPNEPVAVKTGGNPWKVAASWDATLIVATGHPPADLPENLSARSPGEIEALLRAKGLNVMVARYAAKAPERPRFQ